MGVTVGDYDHDMKFDLSLRTSPTNTTRFIGTTGQTRSPIFIRREGCAAEFAARRLGH